MRIHQTAAILSAALDVQIDKTHENAYQRVFKHKGTIDYDKAVVDGMIVMFKDGQVVKEFSVADIRFVAVTSLNMITASKDC